MARIVCYSIRSDVDRAQLAAVLDQSPHEVVYHEQPCTAGHIDTTADGLIVFPDCRVDSALLDECPNLRIVATRSTGTDHLDLAGTRTRGVTAANVVGYGDPTVAEFAFGMLLILVRKLRHAVNLTDAGEDLHPFGGPAQGRDLSGLTVGVVGTGHIGRAFIKRAQAFDMHVLAHDETPDPQVGADYEDLDTLLSRCDVLTLHAPGTARTEHLIDDAALRTVKPGMMLINTARGSLVDNRALLQALQDGRVGGAALDVLDGEELEETSIAIGAALTTDPGRLARAAEVMALRRHPNVLLTRHQAGNTEQAQRTINTQAAEATVQALSR